LDKPVKVKILDNEYLIKSEEEEIEEVFKIAEYVNSKVKEVSENSEGLSEKKTAILAALHIASDYFKLLKEKDRIIADYGERSKALVYSIDSQIN
jgi:cell division protein ZapA